MNMPPRQVVSSKHFNYNGIVGPGVAGQLVLRTYSLSPYT
jgi:hypothetical protein